MPVILDNLAQEAWNNIFKYSAYILHKSPKNHSDNADIVLKFAA